MDVLEARRLFAWGAYPQLIDQDVAAATYPNVTGAGQRIVVIDSGVNANHTNLAGKLWKNPGEIAGDLIDNDRNGYVDDLIGYDFFRNDGHPDDEVGHGTAIAGIIAARPFTYGGATYAGVAQGAQVISLKVLDLTSKYSPGTQWRIEKALQWVEAMHRRYAISAVNLSLYTPPSAYAASYKDEVQRLASAGVILSASGGQDNPNTDVHYPSADPLIWASSVVDASGVMSSIVNRGPGLDLLAPGKAVPILTKTGSGFAVTNEGSSFSTAFTTGAAALLRQMNGSLSASAALAILKDSGVSVKDTTTQYTYSGLTYKRLDLDGAIRLAIERAAPRQTPFKGTPFAVGSRIEAEDFDNGGEGVAFHDTTAANIDGKYRATAVDIGVSGDGGGGHHVSYAVAGEWLEYTINVMTQGTYALSARVASPRDGAKFRVEVDGLNVTGSLAVPNTGGWQSFRVISKSGLVLSAGTHVLRVRLDVNNVWGYAGNWDWFSITSSPQVQSSSLARALDPLSRERRALHEPVWGHTMPGFPLTEEVKHGISSSGGG
jgi:hypothetical protein